jgi:uncharacterized heparinase superfamily protein
MNVEQGGSGVANVLRYWHTIRHLRPTQVVSRARFTLWRAAPDRRPAPPRRVVRNAGWVLPAPHRQAIEDADTFNFLNERRTLSDHGWDDPAAAKLWRYNLHYFNDLVGPMTDERRRLLHSLMTRWVDENPPGAGTGWEPYPTSLRIVNWIKWGLGRGPIEARDAESLAIQVRWLRQRLEYHLLGNHLFANAKALVFAGVFFDGPEALRWLNDGLAILARQIPAQILRDGGHFEQSTMYHALALDDMLDLVNLSFAFADVIPPSWRRIVAHWPERVQSMRAWLRAMCHPDGEIAFFNDAALGVACSPAFLDAYATRLGLPALPQADGSVHVLDATGYIRAQQPAAVALLDVGRVGPDHLPAHAHADTLSFELSVFGRRVLVNSGTSCYGVGAERLRQRGTSAHNTVVVDGENSSDVWSGFRVGHRARPIDLRVADGDRIAVSCAHDGYRNRGSRATHTRRWILDRTSMVVEDEVGAGVRSADARFHLHPAVACDIAADPRRVLLQLPGGATVDVVAERGLMRVEEATWHPEFGVSVPTHCIVVALEGGLSSVRLSWEREGAT